MKAINRLFQYFEYKGIKPTRLEKELGLSNGYLGIQLKRNADLGSGVVESIVNYCRDLDVEWVITGRSNMIKGSSEVITTEKPKPVANSSDLIATIVSLSGENALLKQKIEELEKQKIYNQPVKYGAVAEPISKLKKGGKDFNKPIPENQLVTHKK